LNLPALTYSSKHSRTYQQPSPLSKPFDTAQNKPMTDSAKDACVRPF
jgi:hypothetical protein